MFTLKIETDNAAFGDAGAPDRPGTAGLELARLLRDTADELELVTTAHDTGSLFDANGNRVGSWELSLSAHDAPEEGATASGPSDEEEERLRAEDDAIMPGGFN